MNETSETQRLVELENNLKKQLESARRGSLESVEKLADRCQLLMEKIKATGLNGKPQYKSQLQHIEKLYRDLLLLLSCQKDAVAGEIKSIAKSKKMLATYRGNI
jgi:hypothetical protein